MSQDDNKKSPSNPTPDKQPAWVKWDSAAIPHARKGAPEPITRLCKLAGKLEVQDRARIRHGNIKQYSHLEKFAQLAPQHSATPGPVAAKRPDLETARAFQEADTAPASPSPAPVDPIATLKAELLPASDIPMIDRANNVLAWVAKFIWEEDHGGDCPANRIPTLLDISTPSETEVPAMLLGADPQEGDAAAIGALRAEQYAPFYVALSNGWYLRPEAERGRPPLETTIRDWWNRPTPVKAFEPKIRGSLPKLGNIKDRSGLPQLDLAGGWGNAPSPQIEMFEMPVMGPVDPRGLSWLLWVWDRQAGTDKMQRGGVVPWEQHLFLGSLLHLGISDRDGLWHSLPRFTFEDLGAWLFPDGWNNRVRDTRAGKFAEALKRWRRLSVFPLPCGGEVQIMAVSYSIAREIVEIGIRIPPQAAKGDPIDWPALCRYRVKGAKLYRAYLAACAWLGRSARHGQGLTAEIPAPILGADGTRMRRKGGKPIRSETKLIPNPAAKFNPLLSVRDLTLMIGFDPDNRDQRRRALEGFEEIGADGVIDFKREIPERRRGGWDRCYRVSAPPIIS